MANMIDFKEKVLQVKNLKKYFRVGSGKRKLMIPAVDGVTFDIFKREVFGVVGESGSGKTTLGRTIIKLYQPTDGSVTLNNIPISAGYMGITDGIERLKKNIVNEINALNPTKTKSIALKKEAQSMIESLRLDIANLIKEKNQEIASISKHFDQYRADLYQIKAMQQIELQTILFEFNQKVMKARLGLQNDALLKYKNEVKIAKTKFETKLDGLKDSAALQQTTIDQRIYTLKHDYEAQLKSLESTYKPQIEENAKSVLTKQVVANLIATYAKEKNLATSKIKSKFSKQLKALVAPNKASFQTEKSQVDQKYAQLIAVIQKKINGKQSELKLKLAKLPKDNQSFLNDPKVKSSVEKIKHDHALKIKELKQKLQDAKRINQSADTLRESQKMQMIFQDPISSLNPRMTVKEIIGEGLVIQGNLKKAEIEKKVAEVLELVGLSPEYASRYPHEFSGGQRQRIGVARALIMNPNVIIADEPISSLDVSIRAQIINLLFNLREKLGLTILFIAHDLSVVRFFCDRIAVMYNGKVVEMATSEELFKRPMHPYTVSLLSAIPQPDPDYEKNRKRIHYHPKPTNYRLNPPSLQNLSNDHYVFANETEFASMKEAYQKLISNEKKGSK
jgi:oligopeptide transport system ATP-binding protein